MLPDIRVGMGYDIHSFIEHDEGSPHFITLCGVQIPYPKRLNGHSDSDVAFHALTDAILGTYNLGDIGTYFPPSEEKWKNSPSNIFLKKALSLIQERKGTISNVDLTIIAQAPKIMPWREQMCANIAQILNLELNRVNIKATTNEQLGSLGRGEGIAAFASACVIF